MASALPLFLPAAPAPFGRCPMRHEGHEGREGRGRRNAFDEAFREVNFAVADIMREALDLVARHEPESQKGLLRLGMRYVQLSDRLRDIHRRGPGSRG